MTPWKRDQTIQCVLTVWRLWMSDAWCERVNNVKKLTVVDLWIDWCWVDGGSEPHHAFQICALTFLHFYVKSNLIWTEFCINEIIIPKMQRTACPPTEINAQRNKFILWQFDDQIYRHECECNFMNRTAKKKIEYSPDWVVVVVVFFAEVFAICFRSSIIFIWCQLLAQSISWRTIKSCTWHSCHQH